MPSSVDGKPDSSTPRFVPMRETDLEQVLRIERASYPSPWRREHFLNELHSNPFAANYVLREGSRVVGYACVWLVDGELRINNLAVLPEQRGRGLGARLLRRVLAVARDGGCREATLEVRVSNLPARRLYRRLGFREYARSRAYYTREGEDAVLMRRSLDDAPPVETEEVPGL